MAKAKKQKIGCLYGKEQPLLAEFDEKNIRTLSWDPGKVNFAYALHINGKLVEAGLVDVCNFVEFITRQLIRLKPNRAVLERYMYRGAASVSSEPVNQMIGKLELLLQMHCKTALCQITAAQWKAYFKKILDKKKDFSSKEIFPAIKIEHMADASCIGRYYDEYWINKAKKSK